MAAAKHLRSIRARITIVSTALVAATLVIASMLLMQWVKADLLDSAQQSLDQALDDQAQLLGYDPEFVNELTEGELLPGALQANINGGEVFIGLFSSRDDTSVAFGQMEINGVPVAGLAIDVETGEIEEVLDPLFEEPLDDPEVIEAVESLAFEVLEVASGSESQFLVGATPLDEIEQSVEAIQDALTILVPLLALVFGGLTWLLVGRSLRPVMSITEQVEAISTASLDRRVPVPDTEDEVANLATVMNRMLDRLQRGGERQRQFAADASHELRSPLSTVRAAAELLGRSPSADRAARLSDDIVAETDRMDELIGDLLELSRLDEHRGNQVLEPVDLVPLLALELQAELAEGRVELLAPPSVMIIGSPSQLRRAARNLVDNALRHADRRVAVTVASEPGIVILAVDDDGAGVPDENKPAVFERFSRLDEARTRDAGGSGLGLALVRAIAEVHNAMVSVTDSTLGGARFVLTFPAMATGVSTP